jgi:hypothetical protein
MGCPMDWGKSCDGECSSCRKERRKEEEEKTDAQIIIELREEVKFLKEYHKKEMNRLMDENMNLNKILSRSKR